MKEAVPCWKLIWISNAIPWHNFIGWLVSFEGQIINKSNAGAMGFNWGQCFCILQKGYREQEPFVL